MKKEGKEIIYISPSSLAVNIMLITGYTYVTYTRCKNISASLYDNFLYADNDEEKEKIALDLDWNKERWIDDVLFNNSYLKLGVDEDDVASRVSLEELKKIEKYKIDPVIVKELEKLLPMEMRKNDEDDLSKEKTVKFKKGEIYGLKTNEILFPSFNTKNDEQIQFYNISGTEMLLVKYLGDNRFQEYYSGLIINLISDTEMEFKDRVSFYEKCIYFTNNPFCVCSKSLIKFDITDENIKKFSDNANQESRIIKVLTDFKKTISLNLKTQLDEFVKKDYRDAYIENCVYDFERGKNWKSRVLSPNKQKKR